MVPRPSARSHRLVVSTAAGAALAIERCLALLDDRGAGSSRTRADDALEACRALDGPDLERLFDFLAGLGRSGGNGSTHPHLGRRALDSPCRELLRRLNLASGGTALLVELRRRLLIGLDAHPSWALLEAGLADLLRTWFADGFLELRRIDWDTSSAVLEFLIRREAVQPMRGWRDLHRRLGPDRRCYALFHPALPDEPVAFAELALTPGLSADVRPLVDPDAPVADTASSRCAVFYSISSCHEGLKGVPFGNTLLRRAIDELIDECPQVNTFATLSPIPGFRNWLASVAEERACGRAHVSALLADLHAPGWAADPARSARLERALVPLCAFFLTRVKHGTRPADAVARFHLGNGARLERINWLGDASEAGLRRSAGLTVNYLYRLPDLERNHRAYAAGGVAASPDVRSLARRAAVEFPDAAPAVGEIDD